MIAGIIGFLDTLPDENGEITTKVHVEQGLLDVIYLDAEGFAHDDVVGAIHFVVECRLKKKSFHA